MAQGQNLDFNIAANVSGMEEIATLINRVGALEKEIKSVQQANAGLANSTNTVIRNGTRYNNVMDAQSRALRNTRQGTQQLGMQINDFATSVSTGASITQAFNQQIGQVGFALSMMGGRLGSLGTFLAGPWGIAITGASLVLIPFIERLLGVGDAASQARTALQQLGDAQASTLEQMTRRGRAQNELNGLIQREAALRTEIQRVSGGRLQGDGRTPMFAYRQYQELLDVQRQIRAGQAGIYADNVQRRGEAIQRQRAAATRDAASADVSAAGAARELRVQTQALNEELSLAQRRMNMRQEREGLEYHGDQIPEIVAGLNDLNKASSESAMQLQAAWLAANPLPALQGPVRLITTEMKRSFDSVGESVNDAFKGMITGATGWKEAMRGIIGSVIDQLWKLYVTQQIVGMVSNALGSFGLPVPTGIPGKAIGGSVTSNQPYMVGERGPELFIPRGNGTIIPTHNMPNGGGGSTVNITVDARGAGDPAAVRAQVQMGIAEAMPQIVALTTNGARRAMSRPRLAGAMG